MKTEDFFDAVKDELFFKVLKTSTLRGEKYDVLKVKTKDDAYFLSAYLDKEELNEKNYYVQKMSFEEYVEIVFDSADVEGLVINIGDEHLYINHVYLRWLQMNADREKFIHSQDIELSSVEAKERCIEEYYAREYRTCLRDVKKMYDKKAHKKAYDFLQLLGEVYPNHKGEILYYSGMICEELDDKEHAEWLYREAIKEEEHNYWLYYKLAQFYQRIGKSDEERKVYETAYTHHRYHSLSKEQLENDGIEYILTGLLQHKSMKKKKIQRFAYAKYAKEINRKYGKLPKCETYDCLEK